MRTIFPAREIRATLLRQPTPLPRRLLTPDEQARYRGDPVGYAEGVLGLSLMDFQKEILRSLALVDMGEGDAPSRTAVMACHGVGKTYVAAAAANWWYDCWEQHIVYITAPTWAQAMGLTFKEIVRQRRGAGLPGRIRKVGRVEDEDEAALPGHYIAAKNAASGEGFQGEHTADVLVILEEAVGVPHYIWEAADGLMTTPGCRMLAIANPTDESGDFGAAVHSPLYRVLTISALDHPNIRAELEAALPPYPRAVRLRWLYDMLRKECEVVEELSADHFEFVALEEIRRALKGERADLSRTLIYRPNAAFQGRVLGTFPSAPDEQVIPRAWLRLAEPLTPVGPVELGVDVALMGTDRTVIMARQGPCLIRCRELRQMDPMAVTGAIVQMCGELQEEVYQNARTMLIKVDITGGLGAGPVYRLQELGYRAVGINSAAQAYDSETYPNRRSELWFSTRERAREKQIDYSRLTPEQRATLEREWTLPKWRPDSRGRKVVETKMQIKKRSGGVSPDYADAANLAFYGVDVEALEAEARIEDAFQW